MMRLVLALIVTAAVVVTSLASIDWPSGVWTDWPVVPVVGALVLGLIAGGEIWIEGRRERRGRLELDTLDMLKGAALNIIDATNLDWRTLGLHAFEVRRTFPKFWQPRLVRLARWRLSVVPPPSGISWTKDKGVIGKCWSAGMDVEADLDAEWGGVLSESDWNDLPSESRYGLSYDEFSKIGGYGAVVATPMMDSRERVVGVVSADAPGQSHSQLTTPKAREAIGDAALATWRIVRPRSRR